MAYKVRQTGQQVQADLDKIEGIEAGAQVNVQSDWNVSDSTSDAYVKNKPTLAAVATSGSYEDLSNKPTIPTVPTDVSAFNNDAGYITGRDIADKADKALIVVVEAENDTLSSDYNYDDIENALDNGQNVVCAFGSLDSMYPMCYTFRGIQIEMGMSIVRKAIFYNELIGDMIVFEKREVYFPRPRVAYDIIKTEMLYATSAEYDSQSKKILLKNSGTILSEIDATAFIKDGMVDSVAVSNGYLVITFNTDSGKEPISIPLTDIFDSGSYYTKSEVDTALQGKQNTLTFDSTPTAQSTNPVTSGGVYTALQNIDVASLIEVTWEELKALRDGGELAEGKYYRITDYKCTTVQEDTQAADHQFDIVLLALSANKLAEEGWAMMNESNVYDVTFADGVTKKCYLYRFTDRGEDVYNIVDSESLLGVSSVSVDVVILDDVNKTATFLEDYIEKYPSDVLVEENLTYNYFQNSNLSAWKVWYSLDNDKSRFAWADDSVDLSVVIDDSYIRYEEEDRDGRFCWRSDTLENMTWTNSETPAIGDNRYKFNRRNNKWVSDGTVQNVETLGTGLPNGRGVIYRLIDEWGNDVPYDFKNIMSILPLTDGLYDENSGVDTYVYTFDMIDNSDNHVDLSMCVNKYDKQALVNNVKWCKNTKLFNDDSVPLLAVNNFYNGYNQYSFTNIDLNVSFYNKILNSGSGIKAQELIECVIDGTNNCTFGYNCLSLEITNGDGLNYGNDGVELVADNNYTHTDNNYTDAEKTKLDAVTEYGRKVTAEDLNGTSDWIKAKLTAEGWEFGKYIYGNAEPSNANYCITHYIPINNIVGHSLTWDIGVATNQIKVAFYTAEGVRTGYVDGATSSSTSRTITIASSGTGSATNATQLRMSLALNNLPQCYIFDNTTGEYIFRADEYIRNLCKGSNLPYGVFEDNLLAQEKGDSTIKTMSQNAITNAIEYSRSLNPCQCAFIKGNTYFNLSDEQCAALNNTGIISIVFTRLSAWNPSYPTEWRYFRLRGASAGDTTDGFFIGCASHGRMYYQTYANSANNQAQADGANIYNGSKICPAVSVIVWDRINGIVKFYDRSTLITTKQDNAYKLTGFVGTNKNIYMFPGDDQSFLYDLQIYNYDIMGIVDTYINQLEGANYIHDCYDGNFRNALVDWGSGGYSTYGNSTAIPYTYDDNTVIMTSTSSCVANSTTTQRGYYVGTRDVARLYESDIEVVSGECKINNRTPNIIEKIVDRDTGDVYSAGDTLGVGKYTICGRAMVVGCWSLTYMSGDPMVVKHTANRQKYISCVMHLKCDTLYNGELYDDQADIFYDAGISPSNTTFKYIRSSTSAAPNFAGQMAVSGNNIYVGSKVYTWKQINNN